MLKSIHVCAVWRPFRSARLSSAPHVPVCAGVLIHQGHGQDSTVLTGAEFGFRARAGYGGDSAAAVTAPSNNRATTNKAIAPPRVSTLNMVLQIDLNSQVSPSSIRESRQARYLMTATANCHERFLIAACQHNCELSTSSSNTVCRGSYRSQRFKVNDKMRNG